MSPASRTHPLKVGTKYRTYKLATDKLASWLGNTVASLLPPGQEPKPGYSISLFITYTELITAARPIIQVPSDIIDAAYNAFMARHETATVLQGTDIESDSRHQHVISIIGDVLKKLRDHTHAAKSTQKAKAKEAQPPKEEESLVASFRLLNVEAGGGSDDEHNIAEDIGSKEQLTKTQKAKLLKKKKKARQKAQATQQDYFLDDYDDDPYFVLMCLLSDLKSMREYIKEIWQEYKDGKIDLVTASLTANATFDVIRTYEDDFPAISSLLSDYSKSMELMLSRRLGKSDEGFFALFLDPPMSWANEVYHIETVARTMAKMPTLADLTFANAFYFLKRPRDAFMISTKDRTKESEDSAQRGKHRQESANLEEDISILGLFAARIFKDEKHFFHGIKPDHLTRQWTERYLERGGDTISLAQAFGAQLYLDIHHVLRQDCQRGYADLLAATANIDESIGLWRKDPGRTAFNEKIQHQLDWNTGFIKLAIEMLSKIRSGSLFPSRGSGSSYVEFLMPLTSLQMNPLLSGIFLFQLLYLILDVGLYLGQEIGSIKRAGQFYYLCQLHRDLYKTRTYHVRKLSRIPQYQIPLFWNDMELVFRMYGKKAFFAGRLPTSTQDLLDLVELSHKDKLDTHMPGRKTDWMAPTQGRIHFPKTVCSHGPTALMHRLFYAKYGSVSHIEEEDSICAWTLETLQAQLESHAGHDGDIQTSSKGTTWRVRDISHIDILRGLRSALQREVRPLYFDFLSFHLFLSQISSRIKGAAP